MKILLVLILTFFGVHGNDPPSYSASRHTRASPDETDRSQLTCDELHRLENPTNSSTITVNSIPVTDEDYNNRQKHAAYLATKVLVATLNLIPVAGSAASAAMNPLVDAALSSDSANVKLIKRGFEKLDVQIHEGFNRIEKLIKFSSFREIERNVRTLMLLDGDIDTRNQTNLDQLNITRTAFLTECQHLRPYTMLLQVNAQLEDLLQSHWNTDVYRSRKGLDNLIGTIHSIVVDLAFLRLNELLLQLNVKSYEEMLINMQLLKETCQRITNTTSSFLSNKLVSEDYWDNIDETVKKVLDGRQNYDTQDNANHLLSKLTEIYTNDKFCVILIPDSTKVWFVGSYVKSGSEKTVKAIGGIVRVIRSKTVHNLTHEQFKKKGKAIEDIPIRACDDGHMEHYLQQIVKERGDISIILPVKKGSFYGQSEKTACDCFMDELFEVRCVLPQNFDHPEFVVDGKINIVPA